MIRRSASRDGFTLAEAIVSLLLASVGLALLFQLSTGSARLRAASDESARVASIAHTRLQEARLTLTGPAQLGGEVDGVRWRIDASEIAQREDGARLLSLEVFAEGESGRTARMTSALAVDAEGEPQ